MLTSDFNYALPDALIAQEPPAERGTSRMMVVHRREARFEHRCVTDLPEYLNPNDLLVVNDTKVFPARLNGVWQDTGGAVELLLTDPLAEGDWACISGSGRPVRAGLRAVFGQGAVVAEILEKTGEGTCRVRFHSDVPLMEALEAIGKVPVPPYIHRTGDLRQHALDKERYQTIYARETGAVAAPTAGLHFTEALFGTLAAKGIARTAVTLHVGPGTFKP
jgi:S-adenosylmethionine:tRNA ribosyltransferase-isomerase